MARKNIKTEIVKTLRLIIQEESSLLSSVTYSILQIIPFVDTGDLPG
jgi:hypothetical protein